MVDKKRIERRKALKKFGQVGLAATALGGIGTGVGSAKEVGTNDWGCGFGCEGPQDSPESDRMFFTNADVGGRFDQTADDGQGSVAVHWYGSFEQDGQWFHDLAVSGTGVASYFFGHMYGMKSDAPGTINPTTSNEDFGQYPAEDDTTVPDWVQPAMALTGSLLTTGPTWIIDATSLMKEKFGEKEDGLDPAYHDVGFRYQDGVTSLFSRWTESCFYHRSYFITDQFVSSADLYGGFGVARNPFSVAYKQYSFELDFWGDDLQSTGVNRGQISSVKDLSNEELREFGIRRVDEELTMELAGKEIEPDYIATESPVTVQKEENIVIEEIED